MIKFFSPTVGMEIIKGLRDGGNMTTIGKGATDDPFCMNNKKGGNMDIQTAVDKYCGEQKPIRYKYPVHRQAMAVIRDTLVEGEGKHPTDDGFDKPVKYHVRRARWHLFWFILKGKQLHLRHAFTRCYMALCKMYDWR